MASLPDLAEKPSDAVIRQVDAWREQERPRELNRELEAFADARDRANSRIVYRGVDVNEEFSRKALIGLVSKALDQAGCYPDQGILKRWDSTVESKPG